MIPDLARHQPELESLCRQYHVQRLDLFGSAAAGKYRPGESDLDFLVEFVPLPAGAYADTYFGLLEALEGLFETRVDLVVASAIKNPYFRESVERTRARCFMRLEVRKYLHDIEGAIAQLMELGGRERELVAI